MRISASTPARTAGRATRRPRCSCAGTHRTRRPPLVLWQVDAVGKLDWDLEPKPEALHALADRLLELYPAEHEVVFYCASVYPIADPIIERVRLGDMRALESAPGPTLYVPPLPPRPVDRAAAERLGLRPA